MSETLPISAKKTLPKGILTERFRKRPRSNLARLEHLLQVSEFDAVVAVSPDNVPYLAGVFIDTQRSIRDRLAVVVWPRDGDPTLIICNIEAPQAFQESWIEDVREYVEFERSPVDLLAEVLLENGLAQAKIGIELGYLSAKYFAELTQLMPTADFQDSEEFFAEIRMVKTPTEIELLTHAGRVTEKALLATFAAIHPGDTEHVLAKRLACNLLEGGAEEINFLYINAGPNTGFPHCKATEYTARSGDIVKSDVGGYFEGYLSDVARTAIIGQPNDEQRSIYERLVVVHQRTIEAARPGTTAAEVFSSAKKAYADVDLHFPLPHAGHSIGISTHEWPMLSPVHHIELLPDTLLYIESRVRWPGEVGYHIEDLVHVTHKGPRVLTTFFPSDQLFVI